MKHIKLTVDFFKRIVEETNQYHQFSSRKILALLYDTADEWDWVNTTAVNQLDNEIRMEFISIEIARAALGVLSEFEELDQVETNRAELHLEDYHGEGDDHAGDPKMEVADIAYYLARLIINLRMTDKEINEIAKADDQSILSNNLQAMRNMLRPEVSEKNYVALKKCIPTAIEYFQEEMEYYGISEDEIISMLHLKLGKRWK